MQKISVQSIRKMTNRILLFIIFSTTSIEAAWFFDSSASNSKVPEPPSPPRCPRRSSGPQSPCSNQPPGPPPPPPCPNQPPGPPPPPPCPNQPSGPPPSYYYQSAGPPPPPPSAWSYQFGPPPPPSMEYYSSSQTYMASAPLPPMPPMPPMNEPSPTYSPGAPKSSPKRSSGKSQDQAQTLSVAAHQSYSIDEQQSSIAMDSTEDISTTAEEKTTLHQIKTTSLFEEKDSSKPDLSCIIFDDSVCSITCNQVCLLYNFESTGVCTDTKSCHCTITSLKSPKMNFDQYETLSLDDLWDQKFSKSTVSAKVLNQIKKYPKMASKVLEMLRKPLRTGDDIKNRLVTAYPDWSILNNLKPRKNSPINRFIDKDYKLDESGLEKRIKRSIKRYQDDILGEFSSEDYLQKLAQFVDTIDDEKQLAKILKQIHETKMKSLIKHANNYLHERGLDLSVEDAESKECDCVDADSIDNIVAGVIIKQFVTMISASSKSSKTSTKKSSKTSSSVKSTTESNTKTSQSEQNSSTTTYANVDQCSCPSEKSTTKYLDDESRWVLPGFDAYIISDCSGAIDEEWSTSGYYVHYTRGASGAYEVIWRKGNDDVNIRVGASGDVTQDWRLNGASISLSVGASGAISQSWDLGDVSYTYTKGASGSTTRRWRNNNRDQSTLSRYQGYISSWCSENYFLVRSGDCIIYYN